MRIAAGTLLVLCAIPGVADGPKVNRGMIEAMQHSLDNKLSGLWPQDPAEVLGLSQGTYIQGYGAVFLSEVNLAPAAGIRTGRQKRGFVRCLGLRYGMRPPPAPSAGTGTVKARVCFASGLTDSITR